MGDDTRQHASYDAFGEINYKKKQKKIPLLNFICTRNAFDFLEKINYY